MKKAIILGFILLILLVGCKPGGKAIAVVSGDPITQTNTYLNRAESALDSAANALNEGDIDSAEDHLDTAISYLIHADVAISKIPYTQKATRDTLREKYDSVKSDYEFLREQAESD